MVIERHNTAEKFCRRVTARKAASLYLPAYNTSGTASGMGLDVGMGDECIRLLVLVAALLPRALTWVYEHLNVTRVKGARLVRQLVNAGLVREHTFATGKRGGHFKILEIIRAGWEKLAGLGINEPKWPTHGGWEHNIIAVALELIGKLGKWLVSFEVLIGDVRLDVHWRNQCGKIIVFQIGVSSPDREAANLVKACQLPVIQSNRLIFVCRDKKFGERVKKLLKDKGHAGLLQDRIEFRLAGEVLQCAYARDGGLA